MKINGLYYYLRKIPVIGKKLPTSFYGTYDLKEVLYYFGVFLSITQKFFFKFLWLGLYSGLASIVGNMTKASQPDLTFFLWFIAVILMTDFYGGIYDILEPKHVTFVDYYQISRYSFARSIHLVEIAYDGLAYLPAFIVGTIVGGFPWYSPIIGVLMYLTFYTLFRYLGRLCFMMEKIVKSVMTIVVELLFIGILILVFKENWVPNFIHLVFSPVSLVVMSILCFTAFWLLLHYSKENDYITNMFERSYKQEAAVQKSFSSSNTHLAEGIAIQDKIEMQDTAGLENLKGESYLNALLFKRYSRVLFKSVRSKVIGIVIVGLLISGISLYTGEMLLSEKTLIGMLPLLFFIMYWLAFGKKIVQLCFVNCDLFMLNYPFYRESQSILRGFMYRLRLTLKYNSVLTVSIFLMVFLYNLVNGGKLSLTFFALLILELVALTVLFSFHELFVYYLLQPFTSDMEVKNPLYSVISWLFYIFAYMNMNIDFAGWGYILFVSIVSILYVLIGLVVIWRLAPRTFKLKD